MNQLAHTKPRYLHQYFFIRGCIRLILILQPFGVYAQKQSVEERRADNLFYSLRYVQAIHAYQIVLQKDSMNGHALKNMAISYRKINDYASAEKIFARLLLTDSLTAENILLYAQCLSANKKYNDASLAYQHYTRLIASDNRGPEFARAYDNLSTFYLDTGYTQIQLLNINSGQSDFSPAYYQKGLLFCSNRHEGQIVKRVFEWDQSAFLDLYYVNDTATIKPLKEESDTLLHIRNKSLQHINDDHTPLTSNDNKTLGYMNYHYLDTGGLFLHSDMVVKRFHKSIQSKYHEGPLAFFSSQDSLIFTRNNSDSQKNGINKLKLYIAYSKHNDSSWNNIKGLPFNNNNYSTGHPAIGPGDTVLYFVSDMPGGYGGTDLYKSYYRMGNWSIPENLGTPINTSGNEMFPFVDSTNTLYFASDGHPGLGGLDLFKTSLNIPDKIKNLGYPANSNYDDFGLIIRPQTHSGYFSSNRRRGFGDDDIYSITFKTPYEIKVVDYISHQVIALAEVSITEKHNRNIVIADTLQAGIFRAPLNHSTIYEITGSATGYTPHTLLITADESHPSITIPLVIPKCVLIGTVTHKDTKLPLEGAWVTIYDATLNDTIYKHHTGPDGKYAYYIIEPGHIYYVNATLKGYFTKPPFLLNTIGHKCKHDSSIKFDYRQDFELEPIVIGRAIKIENIYFDLNKATIRKSAAKELDKIVKLMLENPDIVIELSSHTDCRSSAQYNLTLSDKRAKASANYIISKGINANRITGKGYGESKLINDCACEGKVISRKCSEAEHQANRRTEFQVTGFLSNNPESIDLNSTDESAD